MPRAANNNRIALAVDAAMIPMAAVLAVVGYILLLSDAAAAACA